MPSKQSTTYVFTCYCKSPCDHGFLNSPEQNGAVRYILYGRETCPTTGNSHLQGRVVFTKRTTLSNVRQLFYPDHIEVENNRQASIEYCKKEGQWNEHGTDIQPGQRTDLLKLRDDIRNGKRCSDVITEDPGAYHLYGRTLEKLEDIFVNKIVRTEMTTIIWIWGPTGTGKSHYVYERESDIYVYNYEDEWWDTYDGQTAVLFDDFRGQIAYNTLLRLADKWPYSVPRRGKQPRQFISKRIYITSPKEPEEVYIKQTDSQDSINQLLRRISDRIHLAVKYTI